MKKRYSVTLTVETVEEFQQTAKDMGMSTSIVSTVCDEAITQTLQMLKKAQEHGRMSITDLFTMIGQRIEQSQQEEGNYDKRKEETPGRKKVVKHLRKSSTKGI